MILEAIVTTINSDASINVSPMGPRIASETDDGDLHEFVLRPFETSTTYANLARTRQGVLHVDDDVDRFARAAIGALHGTPAVEAAHSVAGWVLQDACRGYEFEVTYIDTTSARKTLNCRVVASHHLRPFFGFNRARHAVLEIAILATRLQFVPADEIANQIRHWRPIVDKTGGPRELGAFALLVDFIETNGERANGKGGSS